jgi:2-oxoglutarate ferredoxin oxidoreductase subunit gamma
LRYEIRLSGTGGQGIITAGIILSEAALHAGYEVAMSQVYGPESRGGASKAEVVIDRDPIDYPRVSLPDVILLMSQPAYDKYGSQLKPGGLVIIDTTEVHSYDQNPNGKLLAVPITQLAREKLKGVVANILALGVLVGVTGIVSPEVIEKAVLGRVPKGTENLNLEALYMGFEAAAGRVPAR